MELSKFMRTLAQGKSRLQAEEMGLLLALILLDEPNAAMSGAHRNRLRFHLELLDIRLAESDAPLELRQVIAGAAAAVSNWDPDTQRWTGRAAAYGLGAKGM